MSAPTPFLPGSTIGLMGSGQLGRMFALEARKMGYRVHTFSPDRDTPTGQVADKEVCAPYEDEAAVRAFASQVGIADWVAGALPAEKAAIVRGLADQGHKVLMVGDGLNDTAALAAAHVSISPAQALDAARVASDIVLLGRDLSAIADATRIARQATKRMVENFQISAAYNVIAVPLALMGGATPLAAALAMSLSSITVSLNALRLR
jgi:Cu2+-exporting ATPase